jgi:hypothetical protein
MACVFYPEKTLACDEAIKEGSKLHSDAKGRRVTDLAN